MLTLVNDDFETAVRDGLIAIRYRPRIAANSEAMIGVEAVVCRLNKSGWQEAILAEGIAAGHLKQLWDWQLAQAAHAFARMKEQGWRPESYNPNFSIALKIPVHLLDTDEWAAAVLGMLGEFRLPGNCIVIELCGHSAVMAPIAAWGFDMVRDAGVRLALAEFPFKESNLQWLSQHMFDIVKFDRTLLADHSSVSGLARKRDMLNGMIAWLRSLGAEVAIDGIDTEIQFNFFRELAAVEWSGEYFGDALELDDVVKRYREQAPVALKTRLRGKR